MFRSRPVQLQNAQLDYLNGNSQRDGLTVVGTAAHKNSGSSESSGGSDTKSRNSSTSTATTVTQSTQGSSQADGGHRQMSPSSTYSSPQFASLDDPDAQRRRRSLQRRTYDNIPQRTDRFASRSPQPREKQERFERQQLRRLRDGSGSDGSAGDEESEGTSTQSPSQQHRASQHFEQTQQRSQHRTQNHLLPRFPAVDQHLTQARSHATPSTALTTTSSAHASAPDTFAVSTFHLHAPAESVDVWSFEKALFDPCILMVCEGVHGFSLTIIPNIGYKKDDLTLSMQGDMLCIHGRRDATYEPPDDAGYCPSRKHIPLTFTRYIPLPEYLEKDTVSAVYHQSKLHIYLSKKAVNNQQPAASHSRRPSLPSPATHQRTRNIQLTEAPPPASHTPASHMFTTSSSSAASSSHASPAPSHHLGGHRVAAQQYQQASTRNITFEEVSSFSDPHAVAISHHRHVQDPSECHHATTHANQLQHSFNVADRNR